MRSILSDRLVTSTTGTEFQFGSWCSGSGSGIDQLALH
jgi:hypothetical protein